MTTHPRRRFVFVGGIPVFDYMIPIRMAELQAATGDNVLVIGNKLLLPLGTVFRIRAKELDRELFINPMANGEVQNLHDRSYCAVEFGGKHPESGNLSLAADMTTVLNQMRAAFPHIIRSEDDLLVVAVEEPVALVPGGNNKNIIEEIKSLYASPELRGATRDISFEHLFFFDTDNPKFGLIRSLYGELGVSLAAVPEMHVAGLVPRTAYVLTVEDDQGVNLDRIILSNRTNEDTIPRDKIVHLYNNLQYKLRRDDDFIETHMVVNSMTNHEEVRLLVHTLKTAYAAGVCTYVCPTLTLLNTVEKLIQNRYYTTEKERFFSFRKDFIETSVIPYIQYLICNKEELTLLDNAASKRGIDAAASMMCGRMGRGRNTESLDGGRVIVTGGSKGARYTERLSQDRARVFWDKARLPDTQRPRFAERRIVCGDDYVTELVSTLGAGDVFTGIFIGLTAVGWDGGHALRAATLGAQHFIQHRSKPTIADMIAMDEEHVRMGTETELVDVISHHVADSGHPTRYGTIANTVITVNTTQIQHAFREVLALATRSPLGDAA